MAKAKKGSKRKASTKKGIGSKAVAWGRRVYSANKNLNATMYPNLVAGSYSRRGIGQTARTAVPIAGPVYEAVQSYRAGKGMTASQRKKVLAKYKKSRYTKDLKDQFTYRPK